MRERLLAALSSPRYRQFLVYVVGPHKAHEVTDEEPFAFLASVRDRLRGEGFNAFLATNPEIPIEEIDAGTRSLEFARASNVVAFVVTADAESLGVGIETGAVLEDMGERAPDRVLFVHEAGVRSAMIASVADRWNATVRAFETADELVGQVRTFARDVMCKESTGELAFPPGE